MLKMLKHPLQLGKYKLNYFDISSYPSQNGETSKQINDNVAKDIGK